MAREPRPPRHRASTTPKPPSPPPRRRRLLGLPVTPRVRAAPTQGPDRLTPAGSRRRLPDARGAPAARARAAAEELPAPHARPAGPGRVRAAPPPSRPRPAAAPPGPAGLSTPEHPGSMGRARFPAPGCREPSPGYPPHAAPGWVQNPAGQAQFASAHWLLSTEGAVSVCGREKRWRLGAWEPG